METVLDEQGRARLEEAYRSYGAELWRAIYSYVGGRRELADDATAEAFAQAGRRIDDVRDLRPWLFRAAFRIARGQLKGRPTAAWPAATASDPEEGVNELMELCTKLSDAQRRAFVLRDVLGFTTKETADLVGSSEVSVRVHLHAGRRRPRALLEEVES